MHITIVEIIVKADNIVEFVQATRLNQAASIKEAGNFRFDFAQHAEQSHVFILYEAYENAEAAAAHKQTLHYLSWRETVADWMQQPRQGTLYHGIS